MYNKFEPESTSAADICGGNLLVGVGAAAVRRGQGRGAGLPVPGGEPLLAGRT